MLYCTISVPPLRDVVEQALIVLLHVVARVVGANAEHDRAEALKIAVLDVVRRQQGDIESELPQHGRDVVARAHDVADLQIRAGPSLRRSLARCTAGW